MIGLDDGLLVGLLERGVSRRTFLKFCAATTAVLALPPAYAPRVAAAVSAAPRMPVIWLRGQGCGGETEALLRAANPSTAALLLDLLSVDYQDALMVPTGAAAEAARLATINHYPNGYLAVIEGAIPTGDDGIHMTVGGRAFADVVREVAAGAVATIAIGSCAFDGGLASAGGGGTGSKGVGSVVSGSGLVSLPGCPVNVENLTATIVHYLTFKEMPATDLRGRPLFAYGGLIHNQCERRPHFEFGEFVQAWGDEGAQKGWCLYKMGCKGPETFANCPTARYGEGASWPVKAGAACIGCTMPGFWDAMSPFSQRLPTPVPFAPDLTADQIGLAAIAGVGGLAAVHGTASFARSRLRAARRTTGGADALLAEIAAAEAAPMPATAAASEPRPSEVVAVDAPVSMEAQPAPDLEPTEAAAPTEDDAAAVAPAAGPSVDGVPAEPIVATSVTPDSEPEATRTSGEAASAMPASAPTDAVPASAPSTEGEA